MTCKHQSIILNSMKSYKLIRKHRRIKSGKTIRILLKSIILTERVAMQKNSRNYQRPMKPLEIPKRDRYMTNTALRVLKPVRTTFWTCFSINVEEEVLDSPKKRVKKLSQPKKVYKCLLRIVTTEKPSKLNTRGQGAVKSVMEREGKASRSVRNVKEEVLLCR
jgi:hypothetical protein